ncbi:unnamed protein product [Symbiodinium sp. CCMP2456]|nr:unnamed protein product [Symbiodinium sp. CCMP2456]
MAVALVLPDAEPPMRLKEDLDSDFQLPAYLEELLHELDVSQPLLRAEPLSFKVETLEEGEAEFHQESPADADAKEAKEQDDSEVVAALAAAAAVRAAKLAEFADKTVLGKRKKQQHRKARFPTGPIFEPQILWKPDANGGRPVPKREDLRAALTYQESGTAPRPSTVPTPRGLRRGPRRHTGRKTGRTLLQESPTFPLPSSRPQTTGALPGLEVHGLEVVTGDSKVHGELVISPRPPSAERRSSTPDRASARLVECPMLVTAMPGPCRSPQPKPRYMAQRHSFGPSNTLESLASVLPLESVADDDFDRQISPHPGFHFGVALRHPQLLLPMPGLGSPKGEPGLASRSVPPVRDFGLEPEESMFAAPRNGAAEGGSGRHSAAASFEVQLPRLQHQATTVTDACSSNVSQELHSEGSEGTFGLEWPGEDSQLLGPLPSSPSACSRDLGADREEPEFKDRVFTGSTDNGAPDLDKENEKAVATESHHQGSQNLPIWQEANVSYHSMLEGLGPRRVSGQVEPQNSELPGREDTLEFEASREEEVQLAYLVPPWSLREHLHLDSERYLPRDDTPMDPEVCAILKGLERAPALQNSRPSSRASPSRPGSARRLSSSDFDSLAPTVHAPRGLFTAGGHRMRRHLVTPSPTLSNPDCPARARTQTPTRPEGRSGHRIPRGFRVRGLWV